MLRYAADLKYAYGSYIMFLTNNNHSGVEFQTFLQTETEKNTFECLFLYLCGVNNIYCMNVSETWIKFYNRCWTKKYHLQGSVFFIHLSCNHTV